MGGDEWVCVLVRGLEFGVMLYSYVCVGHMPVWASRMASSPYCSSQDLSLNLELVSLAWLATQ